MLFKNSCTIQIIARERKVQPFEKRGSLHSYLFAFLLDMAKSARASTRKRNNANLRTKVFGPAFDARTERLSAKLQELANTPKPDEEKKMEVDDTKPADIEAEKADLEADGRWHAQLYDFPS